MYDSWWPHGLYSPWHFPGQNIGVGSLSLLQGIFPTQGLNPGLPHCRWILYHLSHQWSPSILEWVAYPFSKGSSQPTNRTGVSCISGGFFTKLSYQGSPQNNFRINTQVKQGFRIKDQHLNKKSAINSYITKYWKIKLGKQFHSQQSSKILVQRASLVVQIIKNQLAMQETRVQSPGWEDLLEKGMATHSRILAWRIPWIEESGRPQLIGLQRLEHDWMTNTYINLPKNYNTCMHTENYKTLLRVY